MPNKVPIPPYTYKLLSFKILQVYITYDIAYGTSF